LEEILHFWNITIYTQIELRWLNLISVDFVLIGERLFHERHVNGFFLGFKSLEFGFQC